MFTGIIQAIGRIVRRTPRGGDVRLDIQVNDLDMSGVSVGDSIAVDGACLTVAELTPGGFTADVSRETLSLTALGDAREDGVVNLEKALALGQPLGGHLVSGHVDGIGTVVSRSHDARSLRMAIQLPAALTKFVARKGSITVNGVSLTVNAVVGSRFEVNLIPHTLQVTNLGELAKGDRVNVEVDLIARYLERLLPPAKKQQSATRKKARRKHRK
jgi:riboflavin synthase